MGSKAIYKEVIRPPLWLIAFMYFMLFSLVLAIWAAFNDAIAINAFAISVVLGIVAIYFSSKEILIDQSELRVGKAHIPIIYLGEMEIVGKKDFGNARTRGADPAAFFALTFWVSEGVKIEITDQRDPTPYWLISTRKAQQLLTALKKAKNI
jgi:hypothetical protein